MPKRFALWKEELSKDLLRSVKNRQAFYIALLEEGYAWREALNLIIKYIGLKEYAKLIQSDDANLLNQLKPEKDIRISTLEKLLVPLGLTIMGIPNQAKIHKTKRAG